MMDLNDKLVKAIYTSDIKEKIVLEGSYAIYKVIMRDTPKNPKLHNRVIKISDLDVDLYDEIEKLWEKHNGASDELDNEVYMEFKKLFSGVIENLKKYGIVANFQEGASRVTLRNGNKIASFGFDIIMYLKSNEDDIFEDEIKIDVNIIKTPIDKITKSINIDDEEIKVQIYKNEKYFANKLMAFNKHLYFYHKGIKENDKHTVSGNVKKLELDHFDIVFIQKYLYLDYYKIDEYLKLMGSALMYDDYVKLINEWVKGGKK